MAKENFIRTSDERTASKLRSLGYVELGKQGNMYCFVNDRKLHFDEADLKMSYTNTLALTNS